MSFTETGGFGLFYYPPTFAPMLLPFARLGADAATWRVDRVSVAAFLAGVAILPVSRSVRWWLLLLAGLSFPFVYAVKLGQVGPLLFLPFAIGWRWLDDPDPTRASGAVGAAVKLQPGLVLVWALLTASLRRGRHRRRHPRRAGHRRDASCRSFRVVGLPDAAANRDRPDHDRRTT